MTVIELGVKGQGFFRQRISGTEPHVDAPGLDIYGRARFAVVEADQRIGHHAGSAQRRQAPRQAGNEVEFEL